MSEVVNLKNEELQKPVVEDSCIGCGKCVADCVKENIVIENGKAVTKDLCINCGHCVSICPTESVHMAYYDESEIEKLKPADTSINADDFLLAIKSRRSIRQYKCDKIDQVVIDKLLTAGRYTATAKNNQGNRFIVIQNQYDEFKKLVWDKVFETVKKNEPVPNYPILLPGYQRFIEMMGREEPVDYIFRDSPAAIVICNDDVLDAALAAQNIEMLAVSMGLGVLYNGYLTRTINAFGDIKKWLGMDSRPAGVSMLIGYPSVSYYRTAPRKAGDFIVK